MASIQLTQGKHSIVDSYDLPLVNQYKWHAQKIHNQWYAYAWTKTIGGFNKRIALHRLLLNFPSKYFVDHINGNGLDNRRINLRIVTNQQNQWNQKRNKFKGITFNKRHGKFHSRITVNKKKFHLGSFNSAKEAAMAYDQAAIQFFGKFASFNFPGIKLP